MTINQYIKSLERIIGNENSTRIQVIDTKQRLSDIKDALETLGEKEVKGLCVNRISDEINHATIEFFVLCYRFAKSDDRPFTFWGDHLMNKHAVDIYEAWRQHHA